MLQCNVKDCGISEWEGAERNGTLFSPENLLGIIIGRGSLGHVDIGNPYVGMSEYKDYTRLKPCWSMSEDMSYVSLLMA
jgi:hypothetical protein